VDLYAKVPGTRGAARVLVGTGTYRQREGTDRLDVQVELNATGRALLSRSRSGLKVRVNLSGTSATGASLDATGVACLVPKRITATIGGFAVNSATLTRTAKRTLDRIATQVGSAQLVRCAGNTDASSRDGGYLYRVGMRRAEAVFAYLAAHGVDARWHRVSRGAAAPRATNRTAAGRALNRRVELRIDR
jgi:outer membrane protein OmpA-like peptidoglycan-associated protein